MALSYDPKKNDHLEDRAKDMAEYYMAHREKMGDGGIHACLHRVAQENPPLYAHLNRELGEFISSQRRGRRPK